MAKMDLSRRCPLVQSLRQRWRITNLSRGSSAISQRSLSAVDARFAGRDTLLQGPIASRLIGLALPILIMLAVQTLVSVAETYLVGFLGDDALAGVALVFPILMLMTMMSNGGIGGGVASAIARAIGAGRMRDAEALMGHSVVIAVAFGAVFTTAILGAGEALFSALGGRGEVLAVENSPERSRGTRSSILPTRVTRPRS
jgi:Na+-driven multidrug efflux pump